MVFVGRELTKDNDKVHDVILRGKWWFIVMVASNMAMMD